MNCQRLSAMPTSSVNSPNSSTLAHSTRRRPNRSPSGPAPSAPTESPTSAALSTGARSSLVQPQASLSAGPTKPMITTSKPSITTTRKHSRIIHFCHRPTGRLSSSARTSMVSLEGMSPFVFTCFSLITPWQVPLPQTPRTVFRYCALHPRQSVPGASPTWSLIDLLPARWISCTLNTQSAPAGAAWRHPSWAARTRTGRPESARTACRCPPDTGSPAPSPPPETA